MTEVDTSIQPPEQTPEAQTYKPGLVIKGATWITMGALGLAGCVGLARLSAEPREPRVEPVDSPGTTTTTILGVADGYEGPPISSVGKPIISREYDGGGLLMDCTTATPHTIRQGDTLFDLVANTQNFSTNSPWARELFSRRYTETVAFNIGKGIDPNNIQIGTEAYVIGGCSLRGWNYPYGDSYKEIRDTPSVTITRKNDQSGRMTDCEPKASCMLFDEEGGFNP